MNARDAKRILVVVKGLWGERFTVTPEAVTAWRLVLRDCDPEEVALAAVEHCRGGAIHPPAPGELCALLMRGDVDRVPTAAEAWEDAVDSVKPDDGGEPCCSFPLAQRTAKVIGWDEISDPSRWPFCRPQFLRLYAEFASAERGKSVHDEIQQRLGAGKRSGASSLRDGLRKLLGGGK